jgi:hypothetical protein
MLIFINSHRILSRNNQLATSDFYHTSSPPLIGAFLQNIFYLRSHLTYDFEKKYSEAPGNCIYWG